MGYEPSNFQFRGNVAIPKRNAPEHYVQEIVNHFKRYLEMATRTYQREVNFNAKRKEQEERKALQIEQETAEARARILSNVKI